MSTTRMRKNFKLINTTPDKTQSRVCVYLNLCIYIIRLVSAHQALQVM